MENNHEDNPVRSKLSVRVEEWKWSSFYARKNKTRLLPDVFKIPVLIGNTQVSSLRLVSFAEQEGAMP
jgi:hypothetical protein